jgi:hypothetical protein
MQNDFYFMGCGTVARLPLPFSCEQSQLHQPAAIMTWGQPAPQPPQFPFGSCAGLGSMAQAKCVQMNDATHQGLQCDFDEADGARSISIIYLCSSTTAQPTVYQSGSTQAAGDTYVITFSGPSACVSGPPGPPPAPPDCHSTVCGEVTGGPPPAPPDCHATVCGEVTCVGKGCVSVPLILILLCCCCACYGRQRRRWTQQMEMASTAANAIAADVPSTHYYYGDTQRPVYASQPPGCVAQPPVYMMQQSSYIGQQPGSLAQGDPMGGSQPVVMGVAAPTAVPVSHTRAPPLAPAKDTEVPMGMPVS